MNTNYAEVKLRKLGETSATLPTVEVGGNPEPSPVTGEGVETRHVVCIRCGEKLSGKRDKKYCSVRCRSAAGAYRHAVKTGRIKNPGVGSGVAQWGKDNHSYKNGIKDFNKRALEAYGAVCNRCGNTHNILVHHIDEDRNNNELFNLEVLCKSCHQNHHCKRDLETGKYIKR
jgi:hypothetical protein